MWCMCSKVEIIFDTQDPCWRLCIASWRLNVEVHVTWSLWTWVSLSWCVLLRSFRTCYITCSHQVAIRTSDAFKLVEGRNWNSPSMCALVGFWPCVSSLNLIQMQSVDVKLPRPILDSLSRNCKLRTTHPSHFGRHWSQTSSSKEMVIRLHIIFTLPPLSSSEFVISISPQWSATQTSISQLFLDPRSTDSVWWHARMSQMISRMRKAH